MSESSLPPSYKYKYSIACCARWEHEDVLEWVSYHKSLGFDHIYLFSNDDDPMPTFKVLTPFLFGDAPFVTFKHYPKPTPNAIQQADIYYYFMKNYLHETEWFSFIDVDEFFVLKGINNIHKFMREFENDYDAVYFNWLIYGHSGKAERDNESLLLGHTQCRSNMDVHTKMITRSSLIDPDAVIHDHKKKHFAGFWHFWSRYEIPGQRQVNVLGVDMAGYGLDFPQNALTYVRSPGVSQALFDKAYLAHFQFRSVADVRRRVARGGSLTNAHWQKVADSERVVTMLSGTNDRWDVYLARYWMKRCRDAFDIALLTEPPAPGRNIALRKPNIQSSWYEPVPQDPKTAYAQGHGNNGIRTGTYGFRTKHEDRPWWKLHFLENARVSAIHIYNDLGAGPDNGDGLVIETSMDQVTWTTVFTMTPEIFASWKAPEPLKVTWDQPFAVRFLRLTSNHPAELRFDEVEVYGEIAG